MFHVQSVLKENHVIKKAGSIFSVLLLASAAGAQDYKIEVSGYAGWTFSDGVPIDNVEFEGQTFNRITPKSGGSYGFTFGVFVTENVEIEFALDQQRSALEASGRDGKREFTDMKLNNYHANFVYNWGDDREVMRPFIFGGVGATQYKPADVMGNAVESNTRFSSNWGGGIKMYPSSNVGIKILARWTPTYIKSDPGGIWCSPFWPWVCYHVADTQYSNQFQLAGGVTLRF